MRQLLIVAIAMITVVALATPIFADTGASATVNVSVNVNPNVSLVPINANVNAGTVQTGTFTAFCAFEVDANSEQVSFQVAASNLYKGDDPTTSLYIPLDLSVGPTVQPVHGEPLNFASPVLSYTSYQCTVAGFPAQMTGFQAYESSQAGVFSQEVDVTVTWIQSNPEMPTGQYSGVVELIATLLPTTGS
jgi:hypothetical protein